MDLHSLHTQAERGLVSYAGDQCDPIISHLIGIGVISTGNLPNKGHFIGLRALVGFVFHRITDFDVLQFPKIRVVATVVAK